MFKIVCILLFVLLIPVLIKYIKLKNEHEKLNKYLYNYLNTLISARYGNLNVKIEDGFNELTNQLSKDTNALLESIYDRNAMINENIETEKVSQNLKQDFISCVAHDLKVPLIAQDNTFDLFLKGAFGQLSEVQKNAISNLKISNNDLKNMIFDLLDARKLEIHRLEPKIEHVNLNELINETIEQTQSIITIKNKEIHFIEKEKIDYELDPLLFKRVLNNLISNAIYHGQNSKNIEIILEKTQENVEISVIDEGEGIKEDINEIFKKYYSSSNKYSSVGAGLGLYIANKIISCHGGNIVAQNVPSKGACFKIVLKH